MFDVFIGILGGKPLGVIYLLIALFSFYKAGMSYKTRIFSALGQSYHGNDCRLEKKRPMKTTPLEEIKTFRACVIGTFVNGILFLCFALIAFGY